MPKYKGPIVKPHRCPICYETIIALAKGVDVADNALGCPNAHQICIRCVKQLVKPTPLCSVACGGFSYECPMCRSKACLRPVHVLAVLRGSHSAASELISARFDNEMEFNTQRWDSDEEEDDTDEGWVTDDGEQETFALMANIDLD